MNKDSEIVERGLWDHYSELPNPSWYEYKEEKVICKCGANLPHGCTNCVANN